jgi:cobalt/nickel transport system permease protein
MAMGVAGGFAGYLTFRAARRLGASWWIAAFLAGLFSDWATYAMTALELALGLQGQTALADMFIAILAAFSPTQLPLGILEGVAAAGALGFIRSRRPELMAIFAKGGAR